MNGVTKGCWKSAVFMWWVLLGEAYNTLCVCGVPHCDAPFALCATPHCVAQTAR